MKRSLYISIATCILGLLGSFQSFAATGSFTATGSMAFARQSHTATLLPNGSVLVAGGMNATGTLATAELFHLASGTFTRAGNMRAARVAAHGNLAPRWEGPDHRREQRVRSSRHGRIFSAGERHFHQRRNDESGKSRAHCDLAQQRQGARGGRRNGDGGALRSQDGAVHSGGRDERKPQLSHRDPAH